MKTYNLLLWFWLCTSLASLDDSSIWRGCCPHQPLRKWRCSRTSSWFWWLVTSIFWKHHSLPFNWLQDALSIIAVWFQDCICPCYSSFSAAVVSYCRLQYLPVLQNPAELIHQIISEVLTADLITDFNPNSAHHPSFACNTLALEKLHRVCCNMNLLADWLGKFLPKSWLGDALHIDERHLSCCMPVTVISGFSWISELYLPWCVYLTKVISVRLLFSRPVE